jgi:hypothetical protein
MEASTAPTSPRWFERIFVWVALAVLVAGGVAYVGSQLEGSSDEPLPPAPTTKAATKPAPITSIDPAARRVAGEFLLSAVARKDLAASWALVHPDMKQGYTLASWKRGDIPIVPFPVSNIDEARFKVSEKYPNEILLEVALIPKPGAGVDATVFHLGLRALGTGAKRHWVVNYWMPRWTPGVPSNPK